MDADKKVFKLSMNVNMCSNYNSLAKPTTFCSRSKKAQQTPNTDSFVSGKQNVLKKVSVSTLLAMNPLSESLENTAIKRGLEKAYTEAWKEFADVNAETLGKIKIKKPELVFSNNKTWGEESRLASYSWISNELEINMDNLYRYAVINEDGNFTLGGRKDIKKDMQENKMRPTNTYLWEENMANAEELENGGKNLFAKLTPIEIAQITKPLIAHELEHCLQLHVFLNTEGVGKDKILENINERSDLDITSVDGYTDLYLVKYEPGSAFKQEDDFPYKREYPIARYCIDEHWDFWKKGGKDKAKDFYNTDINEIIAEQAYLAEMSKLEDDNKGKRISAIAKSESNLKSLATFARLLKSRKQYV